MIGMLVLTMGTSTLTPLLPLYQRDFGLSTGTATLLFVTYTVTVCPTMLIAGNLADRLGRKRLLLPAMATMTLASLVFALAESVPLLFAGRVLQGLAIGGLPRRRRRVRRQPRPGRQQGPRRRPRRAWRSGWASDWAPASPASPPSTRPTRGT